MPTGIFISYRRADTPADARLLHLRLGQRFPDAKVFMDVASIEPGADFVGEIDTALDNCSVLVALIGRQWATLLSAADGGHDYVRHEIRGAMRRGVRVLPVLVDGAAPPGGLPADLRDFARLNAVELRHTRYYPDMDALFAAIQRARTPAASSGTRVPYPGAAMGEAERLRRLLAEAGALLRGPGRDIPTGTVGRVAGATRPVDPAAAEALWSKAEEEVSNGVGTGGNVAVVVRSLAAWDPGRAERVARTAPDAQDRDQALVHVARALAATEPHAAERVADAIRSEPHRTHALIAVVAVVAPTDPDLAEAVAHWIRGDVARSGALAVIARSSPDDRLFHEARRLYRADDPDSDAARTEIEQADAVRIARSEPDLNWHFSDPDGFRFPPAEESSFRRVAIDRRAVLDPVAVVAAVSAADPGEGMRLARSMAAGPQRDAATATVVRRLATTDPRQAALSLGGKSRDGFTAETVAAVAEGLAPTDRPGALRLFAEAERLAWSAGVESKPVALAVLARALHATDAGRAARIAADAEQCLVAMNRKRRSWLLAVLAELDPAYPNRPDELWLEPWK
ncbi:toll/interleukin-1 receptor domain-containing protein [Paractinoplanes toevensis]|nr:toll/interleukin-1 receptor domain-containing protein [Actinoplanes toevensis]